MTIVFEVIDKTRRNIRLTEERWKHILQEHPTIQNFEEIKNVLINPIKITLSANDRDSVRYYGQFVKDKKQYLLVAVKYLNGQGFVITAYRVKKIT